MIERVCPRCNAGNDHEETFCMACGAALQAGNQTPARRPTSVLAKQINRIPAHWRERGKLAALGLAAIAAEAGMAYMQRRPKPLAKSNAAPDQIGKQTERVIAVARRRTEVWTNGQLQRRTEEHITWLVPDEPPR